MGGLRLVLLPGLGADARQFESQRAAIPALQVPDWPDPLPGESLRDFAARVAQTVPAGESLYLGGASFGGMVALEMAALLRPKGVFLIGSCDGPRCLARGVRPLRRLAALLPAFLFRPRRWWLPFILPGLGRLSAPQRELFWAMLSRVPASFIQWAVGAILNWDPTPVSVPVHHVHGRQDRLIPLRRVRADRIVEGAGHLLTLTHPEAVNGFLIETIEGGEPRLAPEEAGEADRRSGGLG